VSRLEPILIDFDAQQYFAPRPTRSEAPHACRRIAHDSNKARFKMSLRDGVTGHKRHQAFGVRRFGDQITTATGNVTGHTN
jgi:hypothetical protein